MFNLTNSLKEEITEAARANMDEEICGFVIGGSYIPQKNVHEEPDKAFRFADGVYEENEKLIQAVVHSHINGNRSPSRRDMIAQQKSMKPWIIAAPVIEDAQYQGWVDVFDFGDHRLQDALIGREFRHGVTDCYSLIRSWYLQKWEVLLPEGPRDDLWWEDGGDLYQDNFPSAGFKRFDPSLQEPKKGDLFLGAIRSPVPNHGGVYLGDGTILHHLPGRLSRREPVAKWMGLITHWLDYVGVSDGD